MSDGASVVRLAHAKVNLALSVGPPEGGKGYHPIASWMAPIDLADCLTLTRLHDSRASRYAVLWDDRAPRRSDIDWPITKDLTVRAHHALEEAVGRRLTVQMRLDKRIPVGAGLGGGSSDAAAMLLALRDLFALDVSTDRLREIGLSLGADVPFFLDEHRPQEAPRAAVVEGFGERVERTGDVGAHATLIVPGFGCETRAVYRAFDDEPRAALRTDEVRALAAGGAVDELSLFNDLASPASRVRPSLADLRQDIAAIAGAPVHITGSGSAMFVIRPSAREADALAEAVRDATPCAAVAVRIGGA